MGQKAFDPVEAARGAVAAARRAIGEKVLSATLYGSAAGGEFHPEHSDVNVGFVLTALGSDELTALRGAHDAWVERRVVRPLLLSKASLAHSRDTFPLEYLLIRERHVALHGPDPFASIVIERAPLRAQVERVLRAQELGLAVSYIALAGTPDGARRWASQASSAIAASASGLLHLHGEAIPATRAELAVRCAVRFGVDAEALTALLRRDGPGLPATRLVDSALQLLTKLLDEVERLDAVR